jgi:hypothetical protein
VVDPFVHELVDAAGDIHVDGAKTADADVVERRLDKLLIRQIQVQRSAGGIIGFHAEADDNEAVQFVLGFRGRLFLAMVSLGYSLTGLQAQTGRSRCRTATHLMH